MDHTVKAFDEDITRLRGLIARIVVRPNSRLRGVDLEVIRQLDEVLNLATTEAVAQLR